MAIAPTEIAIDPIPAGTGPLLLERVKVHPAYIHLLLFEKVNESDISLRDIEEKAKIGDEYRIGDL